MAPVTTTDSLLDNCNHLLMRLPISLKGWPFENIMWMTSLPACHPPTAPFTLGAEAIVVTSSTKPHVAGPGDRRNLPRFLSLRCLLCCSLGFSLLCKHTQHTLSVAAHTATRSLSGVIRSQLKKCNSEDVPDCSIQDRALPGS